MYYVIYLHYVFKATLFLCEIGIIAVHAQLKPYSLKGKGLNYLRINLCHYYYYVLSMRLNVNYKVFR